MPSHAFNVAMTCEGCAGAVRRNLAKLEGIEKVDTLVADRKVVVSGTASSDDMLAAIKKTGKECSYIGQV
ncbi:hypothetical protein CAOG_03345 [Capsaspora owczarzaki ATCC 30864]|uniref:HMA domain-containing protein n=1 Tax=Capsaspora owczarzaki (strain ATCC 30864) TaxID=595528 RepID=A0A0D2VPF7_CAPO3|nr:hypothetical protein CAOG_03345 [Capsaspora owczarzaki ATCC 30864]KJE92362.1 hypothetical protein CAOG_003345 [Capsaspora owczarzaki ATCC 30864]|eukprot:XP_004364184.1 hypothetical protein CAOG_03345 [Capsaspora owczarzaki ATCC 30864]